MSKAEKTLLVDLASIFVLLGFLVGGLAGSYYQSQQAIKIYNQIK